MPTVIFLITILIFMLSVISLGAFLAVRWYKVDNDLCIMSLVISFVAILASSYLFDQIVKRLDRLS